jgi:DNA modification methylase
MLTNNSNHILDKFQVAIDKDWAFADSRSTNNLTHGHHRYPAKFIPQIVQKLIETYTVEGDKIVDVFAGCGTTLVESKIHGRKSEGVDINPVAQLITKAKINPVNPNLLEKEIEKVLIQIKSFDPQKVKTAHKHPRIDYWFELEAKQKITFLYEIILDIEKEAVRDFLLCGLSNIFKNCSKWLQSSTKPQVDPNKKISEVFFSFEFQIKRMKKKNNEFYEALKQSGLLRNSCSIKLADARKTKIRSNSANAIITSPPYVTSYEYADIHQLTGYWFDYISDIRTFRKDFIGTFYSNNKDFETPVPIAQEIVKKMMPISKKKAGEIANYFNDMSHVAKEMHRILLPGGVVCLVIGNTTVKDVEIKSAEGFAEILSHQGFIIQEVIKREIPTKLIPTIRDVNTGKFTTLDNENKKFVYPEEFIIIARKSWA